MINKYVPIQDEVLATQFTVDNYIELCNFTNNNAYNLTIFDNNDPALCSLHIGNGLDITIREGDYVAKTDKGRILVYDKSIFEKKYRIAD